MTLGLAAVLGLGAGVGLKAGQVRETKATGTTRIYLDMSLRNDAMTNDNNWSSSNASFKVQTWGTTPGDAFTVAVKAANNYWYADVDLTNVEGYRFIRYDSTGINEWNRGKWTSDITVNYFVPSAWSGGGTGNDSGNTNGTWSKVNTTNWKVTGHTGGTWAGDADTNIALSSVKFDGDGLQVYSTSVALEANTLIKFTDGTNWYGYDKLSTYNNQSAREKGYVIKATEGDDPNIKVVTGGTYEVYVKPADNSVWMQLDSQSEIVDFSTRFLSAMRNNSVCGSTEARQKEYNKAGIDTVWSTWKNEFENDLTSGARSKLLESNANENVSNAAKLYNHIVGRYGEGYAWSGAPASSNVAMNPIINNSNDNAVVVIVAFSALSLLALCGFFFIRKRKESK